MRERWIVSRFTKTMSSIAPFRWQDFKYFCFFHFNFICNIGNFKSNNHVLSLHLEKSGHFLFESFGKCINQPPIEGVTNCCWTQPSRAKPPWCLMGVLVTRYSLAKKWRRYLSAALGTEKAEEAFSGAVPGSTLEGGRSFPSGGGEGLGGSRAPPCLS